MRPESVLHRAALVVPVTAPPVENGAVLVADGLIRMVGPLKVVQAQAPAGTEVRDHGQTALIPGLVNAHTHIELSALAGKIPLPQPGFGAWLDAFFPLRQGLGPEAVAQGFAEGIRAVESNGTGLFGDITNGAGSSPHGPKSLALRHRFVEVIGFNVDALESVIQSKQLDNLVSADARSPFSLAAHAPYSTSAGIIREAKAWSRTRGLPFSIHAAEHPEEIAFLRDGTGYCRELLERLGKSVPGWKPPGRTPVCYLRSLGVLDERTLLVHAVHLTDEDWQWVLEARCSVCFCPRSNANLNVGRADIAKALEMGVPAALGTDSLASNTDLDLFSEGAFVLDRYPEVSAGAVLSMMTIGGARALGRAYERGSLEPGKRAAMLAVTLPESTVKSEFLEAVIFGGRGGGAQWANG